MPRIENIGQNVSDYCQKTGNGSSCHDICSFCAERDFIHHPKLKPENRGEPLGDNGWFAGPEHPCYSECDYKCEICGAPLDEDDN